MSGETMKVTTAVFPGKRPRDTAIAQRVPRTSEIPVESSAISTDRRADGQSSRRLRVRRYQRSESSGGGRLKTGDELTETATATTSGASSVNTTQTQARQISTRAARS